MIGNASQVLGVGAVASLGIYLYNKFNKGRGERDVQEMLSTKEGREEFVAMQGQKVIGPNIAATVTEACPTCEGWGKTHHTRLTVHGVEHYTDFNLCSDCEGTGLKGGSPDYAIVHCPACGGEGIVINNPTSSAVASTCEACEGRGTIRREKGASSKVQDSD